MKLGVDWGGTKIEVAALTHSGVIVWRERQATMRDDYHGCIRLVRDLVLKAETEIGAATSVGIGIPGTISDRTGRVKNANSEWLNGKPLDQDLASALGRPIRIANDANCLAVSEAVDGAGQGAHVVFAVIIGTGVGGGIAVDGKALEGRSKIAGEWGHTPLPRDAGDETPDTICWCGRKNCLETYLSGTGLAHDYARQSGEDVVAEIVIERMRSGDPVAASCFQMHNARLARALAGVINILDPDIIVVGGGLSNVDELYDAVSGQIAEFVFTDYFDTPIKKAAHGDSSGVRGAAWLWG